MTKSRTLRKAGAVVLSLAMAFSVAGVAPSADAAAKKPALSAKKGTIKVGKTKKVTIKNTTKKKVKKLVVSSNKKAVATVKKNSKVKFTVTGIKAGTAKITATVTLKKAVAKKKVYTLKYTAKVKKAATTPTTAPEATATPSELKLEKVEDASGGASRNVLIAYFSQAVDAIDPSEIQIRRVSDDQLFSVEKVVMAADKKSATVTLVNTSAAGAGAAALRPNVEYKMIVTKNGKTAEKVFTIPAVSTDGYISKVDSKNKQITVQLGTAPGIYTFDDSIASTIDYNEIWGRTCTFQYNRNAVITKFALQDEKVVYGAFEISDVSTGITTIKDLKTATTYKEHGATVGANYVTYDWNVGKDVAGTVTTVGATTTPTTKIAYAKLVLNGDGTIRTMLYLDAWTDYILVDKVAGDSVFAGKDEVNLKDFNIIKDGKSIKIADIQAGDVVCYALDTKAKVAEVYNDKQTDKIASLYTTKFNFKTKDYEFAQAKYIDGGMKACDQTYMEGLKKADKEVNVYFDRTNTPRFITGEQAAAVTSTVNLVLTQAASIKEVGIVGHVYLKGYNAATKKVEDYDINTTDLKTITDDGRTGSGAFKTTVDTKLEQGTVDLTSVELAALQYVTITLDKDGKFIGLARTTGADLTKMDDSTTTDFKKGYKTLNGKNVAASVNVYTIDTKANTQAVATYGETTTIVKNADIAKVSLFTAGNAVSAIVIDKANIAAANIVEDSEAGASFFAIVGADYLAGAGGSDSKLTVLSNDNKTGKDYNKFATGWAGTGVDPVATFKKGTVVKVTVTKTDAEKIYSVVPCATIGGTGIYTQIASSGTFQIDGKQYGLASDALIVRYDDATQAWIVDSSISNFNGTKKKVDGVLVAGSADTVQVLVNKGGADVKSATMETNKTTVDNLTFADVQLSDDWCAGSGAGATDQSDLCNAVVAKLPATGAGWTYDTSLAGQSTTAGNKYVKVADARDLNKSRGGSNNVTVRVKTTGGEYFKDFTVKVKNFATTMTITAASATVEKTVAQMGTATNYAFAIKENDTATADTNTANYKVTLTPKTGNGGTYAAAGSDTLAAGTYTFNLAAGTSPTAGDEVTIKIENIKNGASCTITLKVKAN